MTTRISLSNLPEYALDKTIEKYTYVLTEEYQVWAYCSICAEIDSILSGDNGCQLPMTEVIGLRLRKKSGHDGHID